MLTTLSSGQSTFSLLPTFVWGSVTDKPEVHCSGPVGSSRTDGGSWRAKLYPLLSPQFPAGTRADGRNPLWLTASFHALPTTYRVAPLSHV